MHKLLIASSNQGKISEIKQIFQSLDFEIIDKDQVGLKNFDPPETKDTFEGNAADKAKAFSAKSGLTSLADDSGLVVDALAGRPGVYSKRYGNSEDHRIQKLLEEMKDKPNRTARFISVVCVYNPDTKQLICEQGTVEGAISQKPIGTQGFGYDPIFIPSEIKGNKTFAQLGNKVKNKISHRARALAKIKEDLI